MATYKQYNSRSKNSFTFESMANWPWASIAICAGVLWFIIMKLGNSATWLGTWISKITNPSEYDKQVNAENGFDKTHPTGSAYLTPAKVREDARKLSVLLRTTKNDHWWERGFFVWSDSEYYDIIKWYGQPAPRSVLMSAYASIYTDGRDLRADIRSVLSSDHIKELSSKGII